MVDRCACLEKIVNGSVDKYVTVEAAYNTLGYSACESAERISYCNDLFAKNYLGKVTNGTSGKSLYVELYYSDVGLGVEVKFLCFVFRTVA